MCNEFLGQRLRFGYQTGKMIIPIVFPVFILGESVVYLKAVMISIKVYFEILKNSLITVLSGKTSVQ